MLTSKSTQPFRSYSVRRKRRASAGTLRIYIKTSVNFGGEDPESSVPRVGRRARLPAAWRFAT